MWNWIERYAPPDFRYRIREAPITRALTPDQATVLGRLVAVLRARPDIDEPSLIPHMKTLCDDTELSNKDFFPLAYDLLIDRPKGPKLTTLVTTMGGARVISRGHGSRGRGDARFEAGEASLDIEGEPVGDR